MSDLRAIPVRGIGEVKPGDSLAETILGALKRQRHRLTPGDILVVTHKIVSKAEGQTVPLTRIHPSPAARHWARQSRRDARIVELALSQSRRVVRRRDGVLITETRHGPNGLICANSGVDLSNVDGGKSAALLPRDPDQSAASLRRALKKKAQVSVPVIISDSFGRPWREGLTEVAIGAAGMSVFRDFRGQRDPYGYCLRVTREAVADELACMAGLACDKLSRNPVCIIRGFPYRPGSGRARDMLRSPARDLFR